MGPGSLERLLKDVGTGKLAETPVFREDWSPEALGQYCQELVAASHGPVSHDSGLGHGTSCAGSFVEICGNLDLECRACPTAATC